MWFGTRDKMMWIETPQSGANVSTTGMTVDVGLVNGGAFVRNSVDSAKGYIFNWGDTADRNLASDILAYANGTYGRGRIQFVDPMYYEMNILASRWADPSMALDEEAPDLTGGRFQPSTSVTAPNGHGLPVRSAFYSFPANANVDGLRDGTSLFVPIPPGMELVIGAYYTATGSAAIKASLGGSSSITIPQSVVGDATCMKTVVRGTPFIELYVGTGVTGAACSLQVSGIIARLRTITTDPASGPVSGEAGSGRWSVGQGHSGCNFVGKPQLFNNSGIGGGQVSLSCELRETGSWA